MSNPKNIKLNSITIKPPKFNKDSTFAQASIKTNGKAIKVKLSGDLIMVPRYDKSEYGSTYKFGVRFDDEYCTLFDTLLGKMSALVGEEYDQKEAHGDGAIFFKLKTNPDQNKFMTRSNVLITPQKYTSEKIEKGDDVTVEFQVGGWYMQDNDKEEKKYGLSFTVKEIWWGGEPVTTKRAPPKRKAESTVAESDDDEVRIFESNICTFFPHYYNT